MDIWKIQTQSTTTSCMSLCGHEAAAYRQCRICDPGTDKKDAKDGFPEALATSTYI